MNRKEIPPRSIVAKMASYHVDQYDCKIILDANESAYELTDIVKEDDTITESLNRYPNLGYHLLSEKFAKKESIDPENIIFGNGSDELIGMIAGTYIDKADKILLFSPTFSIYKHISQLFTENIKEIELTDQFDYPEKEIIDAIEIYDPKLIFIARPNNPDGSFIDEKLLIRIMDKINGLVVVDEAYIDYSDKKSILPLLKDYKNMIVMKTLSKIGLAGIRLGYAMADRSIIDELNKVKYPFNINRLSEKIAIKASENFDKIKEMTEKIKKEKQRLIKEFTNIKDIEVYKSEANFILIKINKDPGSSFEKLIKQNVRVRWFKGNPRLNSFFRITVGLPSENEAVIKTLKKL